MGGPWRRRRGIGEIVAANKLNREFRVGHRAAMKYGIAFGVAGAGNVTGNRTRW
jgi:hypothetical protein